MYSIIDVETTGGKYNEEGITEIAVYVYDGKEIVDQFISLVNPERPIEPFVVNLTGIDSNMVRRAPKFYEIAKRVVQITEGTTFVAHNAGFDYRMVRQEFKRLGFEYERDTLCTVELSRKLIPDLKSYKLGNICKELGIAITDRHRASGDAYATVKLFDILLNKDQEKGIIKQVAERKSVARKTLSPKLTALLKPLKNVAGVYYMHDEKGDLIYIGKSKNIRNRINQHFMSDTHKSKQMQTLIESISVEETGSELVALLKESAEIKKNKPVFNRAQRRSIYTYGLFEYTATSGYRELRVLKNTKSDDPIISFHSLEDARNSLFKLVEKHELCQKLSGLYHGNGPCFQHSVKLCKGACIGEEPAEEYNKRVEEVIDQYNFGRQNMLLIDKGRVPHEKSVVLIENGVYKGYGFFELQDQIYNAEVLKNLITPMDDNRNVRSILQNFIRNKKVEKIINF